MTSSDRLTPVSSIDFITVEIISDLFGNDINTPGLAVKVMGTVEAYRPILQTLITAIGDGDLRGEATPPKITFRISNASHESGNF